MNNTAHTALVAGLLLASTAAHAQPAAQTAPVAQTALVAPAQAAPAKLKGVKLPAVQTRPADSQPAKSSAKTDFVPTRQTLVAIPGVNQAVPISKGYLNRIITPFSHPVVHTTSTAQISTQCNVLYVASTADSPTTLYVTPKGHGDTALSLTLIPRPIPPREIRIRMAKTPGGARYNDKAKAGHWEIERPYVATLRKLMVATAKGQMPSGYGLRPWRAGDPMIACAQPTLAIQQGQVLTGGHMTVLVGKMTNISQHRVELDESRCRGPNVMAVAAWPHASLAPGADSEIYVIMRKPEPHVRHRQRPFLLQRK